MKSESICADIPSDIVRMKKWVERLKSGRVLYTSALVLLLYSVTSNASTTNVPPDIRRMPVFIQIPVPDGSGNYNGTGIYLLESNRFFLVTAKHVLFNSFS